MPAADALAVEQEQLRAALCDIRQRMLELGRALPSGSPTRTGWFERATVIDDLARAIPPDGRPVNELPWKIVPRDEH